MPLFLAIGKIPNILLKKSIHYAIIMLIKHKEDVLCYIK